MALAAKINLNAGSGHERIRVFLQRAVHPGSQHDQPVCGDHSRTVRGAWPPAPMAGSMLLGYLRVLNLVNLEGSFLLTVGSSGLTANVNAKLRVFGGQLQCVGQWEDQFQRDCPECFSLLQLRHVLCSLPQLQIFGAFTLQSTRRRMRIRVSRPTL